LHEKIFKEYNISPEDLENKPLRPIPMSWIQDIIRHNVSNIDINPENINNNENERSFTLLFSSTDDAQEFEKSFQGNMFKSINEFIENKSENPKLYNRNIITTTEIEGIQLRISY
ncbi:MAG: hypothetical protein R3250_08365, partial [Melioribacteraceae bacterium]|nr:hypothetical protein [Melioribacteraceae bacterium]